MKDVKPLTSLVIIEDDDVFRKSVVEMLTPDERFLILGEYSNATAFLNELAEMDAQVYWVDINLPDGTGIDLVRKIKKQFPKALCLMCTLHNDDQHVFDALKAGANGYILKNTTAAKMMESIDELLDGGAPMSPYIASKVIRFFQHEGDHGLNDLSQREIEILGGLSKGLLYKEIAGRYGISRETVKKHIGNIYKKLHVQNRTEAVLKYFGK